MPNILVTGTPGTGKSKICLAIAGRIPQCKFVNVGQLVVEQRFFDGFDNTRECHIIDEDKLLDHLEELPSLKSRRTLLEYHSAELFPERWIDAVFVLRTDNSVLYSRLEARGYTTTKIQENVEAEIFQVLLDEATESFPSAYVAELVNNTEEDAAKNIDIIVDWWQNNGV